jgi:hypothetical protein
MHIRTAWNDYFTGNPTSTLSKEYGTRQTLSDTNIYVTNCLFKSITSTSGRGGALSCSSSVTCFLVELSSFFSCKTSSDYGGAIYFNNENNGQCVLHKVCGFDCCLTYTSTTNGQFTFIYVKNDASSKNYVNYSSISRCVNDNSSSWDSLRHCYGKQYFPSVNVSMNKCYSRTGIICIPYCVSNSVTLTMSYSTFADNTGTGYNCIALWTTGAQCEIKSCNILRNAQSSSSEGTFITLGNLMIEDSCILENNANCIFYQASSYTITVSNCTVDKTTSYKSFKIQNTVTKSFIHALNHMSTQNCHSEYDAAGTLTPVIQSPSSSKKQRLCYTFGKCLCQCQLSDLILLTNFLIFNFIHPYASGDSFY